MDEVYKLYASVLTRYAEKDNIVKGREAVVRPSRNKEEALKNISGLVLCYEVENGDLIKLTDPIEVKFSDEFRVTIEPLEQKVSH